MCDVRTLKELYVQLYVNTLNKTIAIIFDAQNSLLSSKQSRDTKYAYVPSSSTVNAIRNLSKRDISISKSKSSLIWFENIHKSENINEGVVWQIFWYANHTQSEESLVFRWFTTKNFAL